MNGDAVVFETMAEGLQFPEGPVALADGSVLVVELRRGTLSRVRPDGRVEVAAELGGGPNGAAIGPGGAVYVCNNGGYTWVEGPEGWQPAGAAPGDPVGFIQRVDLATGRSERLYEACDGHPLGAPNDLVFDSSGGFWFTNFGKSDAVKHEHGGVYYARADGSGVRRMLGPLLTPNGVGLSPDERTLYVADTLTSRVLVCDLDGPGRIKGHDPKTPSSPFMLPACVRVLGPLPGYQMLDSLAVEADGRVCVGTLVNGAITAFSPAGGFEQFPVADPMATNICFGGADMRDAYVTASHTGQLLKARWPRPGLKLPFNA